MILAYRVRTELADWLVLCRLVVDFSFLGRPEMNMSFSRVMSMLLFEVRFRLSISRLGMLLSSVFSVSGSLLDDLLLRCLMW